MRKVKVLLVDDDKVALLLHKRILSDYFEVVTALNAVTALRYIKWDKSIAVVVSDQCMPEMSGVDFLQIVCNVAPDIVRIMITGFADLDVAIQAVNVGNVYRFLEKPCDDDSLVAAVMDGIEQYRQVTGESAMEEALIEPLTEREMEVLRILSCGLSNREIAVNMGVTVGTVKTHINNIFGKLGVNTRTKAVAMAKKIGII